MGKLKIKFHPLFAIYIFLCIYFGWFNSVFYYVIVVTLHEFGHYLMIKYYGYDMDSLVFSLHGAGLKGSNNFKVKHEFIISLAGPIVNILLITITIALWWIFPLSYLFTKEFLVCNVAVLCFNLLPIYPLDGGRIITTFLVSKKMNKNKILKFNRYLCIVLGLILLILFIFSIFYTINFNLLIISFFMFINSISCDKNVYFDKISCLNKNTTKPIEVKVFKVHSDNKADLIKLLNPHYYSIFEIGHEDNKKIIEEKDLFE